MLTRSALTFVLCVSAAASAAQVPVEPPPRTPDGVRDQIARLTAPDPVSRAFAACFLAEMRHDAAAALQPLRRLLADTTAIDPVVCRREFGTATTVLALWKSTPGLEAARALAAIGDEGVDVLLTAAADRDPGTRRHAVRGLTYVRDLRTEPIFVAALRDDNAATRADAARGLGQFRDTAAVDGLLGAIKDPDAGVREQAVRALSRVGRRR